MGGSLSNVFVHSTETERVQAAVKKVLARQAGRAPFALPQEFLDQLSAISGAANAEVSLIMGALGRGPGAAAYPVAYLSPPKAGWIGIHPAQADFERLAERLASELQTVAIGFSVYDDDFLCYHLVRGGEVLDRYNSNPNYFDEGRDETELQAATDPEGLQGNPALLAEACGQPERAIEIGAVLDDPNWRGSAFSQLDELATLLGIEGANVTYNDLSDPYPGFQVPDQEAYMAILPESPSK